LSHVTEPLRVYRSKVEDVSKLLAHLTRDHESAAAIAMEAMNRWNAALDQYEANIHAEFERFAQVHKAGDGQAALHKANDNARAFADTFADKFGDFLTAIDTVVQAERWLFMAKAHRLVQSVSQGLRQASIAPELSPTVASESKEGSTADGDPSGSDILSVYDIPSIAPPHREDTESIVARLHARLEQFFEPAAEGGRWRRRQDIRITQRDMEALQQDVRLLEVVAIAWQKQAGLRLQREAASNIFVLTNFFEQMCVHERVLCLLRVKADCELIRGWWYSLMLLPQAQTWRGCKRQGHKDAGVGVDAAGCSTATPRTGGCGVPSTSADTPK